MKGFVSLALTLVASFAGPASAQQFVAPPRTIADITERAGAGFLSTRIDITTVDEGELVATAFTRLVVRAASEPEGAQ